MARFLKKRSSAAGSAPGTLVYSGEKKIDQVQITIFDYNERKLDERVIENVEEAVTYLDRPTTSWINVVGLHEVELIERQGQRLGLHPLLLEDVVNTGQRPKLEDYGDQLFIVMKMFKSLTEKGRLESEQISIILGQGYVLSFQESEGDLFDPIRERLRAGRSRIRKMGPSYLAYTLLDAIVDGYYVVLENLGERIEAIEERLIVDPQPEILEMIYGLKREMIYLRKSVWPLREVIGGIERTESSLIDKECKAFWRDVYDHTIQVIDSVDTYRDLLSGLQDLYLSSISNKMNEVMKVLTIIATIFIPMTFVAGIYGMNLSNMPELEFDHSYKLFWLGMIAIAGALVYMFRRLRWL